jgi:hypothetical protein
MNIKDGIKILKAELLLERTPKARPITKEAKEVIAATLEDKKNYDSLLAQCLGCGLVASILLSSQGCSNCGVLDLTLEIKE